MNAQLNELIILSTKLGNNPMLVQGAGGNTSLKNDSILWVKASGKRLADAKKEPIFTKLNLKIARSLSLDDAEHGYNECLLEQNSELKPSIETSIHALMPQKVILHVHSIRAISFACKTNNTELEERLSGLLWNFIPYHRPGTPLSRAILKLSNGSIPDVLILGNHGLIVASDTCKNAEILLNDIENRLDIYARPSPRYDLKILESVIADSPYRLPSESQVHDLATDDLSFEIATNGSLYPDHVVFLGKGVVGVNSINELKPIINSKSPPPLILIKSIGAILLEKLNANAEEMAFALSLLTKRIQMLDDLKYLTSKDENDLINWDAEKYRKTVSK